MSTYFSWQMLSGILAESRNNVAEQAGQVRAGRDPSLPLQSEGTALFVQLRASLLRYLLFQNLKQWNPVHAGGLHSYRPDATTLQPLGQGVWIAGEAAEPARCRSSRSGGTAT